MKLKGKHNNIIGIVGKSVATLLLVAVCIVLATSLSPIYNFAEPKPFSGSDIFNPYRNVDSMATWKRANFHTHTRIESPLNECEYSPEATVEAYDKLGYDIVAITNHNYRTPHPQHKDYAPAYEHGYNLLKYHKLVFGAERVMLFDHLLPILPSQRQWQIDMLGAECDFLQLNHPLRTPLTSDDIMRKLSGYMIMELDSGHSTECEYWDVALSAGHYSFGLANDDLHHPDRSDKIARRCNFLFTPSTEWRDVARTLREGGYYSMRLPDYGSGDWEQKYAANSNLPHITSIGVNGDTIYLLLSQKAEKIVAYGSEHRTLVELSNADKLEYLLAHNEPYARFVIYFDSGEVIYTNPFARYDKSRGDYPTTNSEHSVNITLTILYNLLLAALCGVMLVAISRLWRKRDKQKR